jgi:hypothetical protein
MDSRHAFLMEIDSLNSDVIVKRWEYFTGRKTERIPDNSKEQGVEA